MTRRGLAIAVIVMFALSGCAAPPVSEAEFAQRMEAVGGVESAYVSTQQPLPFMYSHDASVWVTSDLSAAQVRAIVAELSAMPDFNWYNIAEDVEHPSGVRWDGSELPVDAQLDFLATVWPAAGALPEGTTVELSVESRFPTKVTLREARELNPESTAVIAASFIGLVADADPQARLELFMPAFSFEGAPGNCPGVVSAVDIIREAAEATSIRVACEATGGHIAVSVLDDAVDVESAISSDILAAGLALTVTPDDFRVDPNVSSELLADITAVVEAAREVPGTPAARTTTTGVAFDHADETTVRQLLEVLEPMPEFDRITFRIGVGDSNDVVQVGKSVGLPVYLDQVLATGRHPAVTRWTVSQGSSTVLEYDMVVNAADVDAVVEIVRGAGLHEATGTPIKILATNAQGNFARITAVIQSDGTLVPSYEVDPEWNKPLLDAWNSA